MKIRPFLSLLALALTVPVVASAIDVPVPGRTGRVRFDKNTGDLKVSESKSKALKGTTFLLPAPGGPDDPRLVGATFTRGKVGTGLDWDEITLDASKWIALGSPAGSKGYKFKGTSGDPCRSAIIKEKLIRVKCKGAGGIDDDFTLPVTPDSVSDQLVVGSIRYCNQFDAPYQKDGAVDAIWKAKVKAKDATAPASCPDLEPPYGSPSKAFMKPAADLFE